MSYAQTNSGFKFVAVLLGALLFALPVVAQTNAAAPQLSDAEAQLLLQVLASQSGSTQALSPAQMQMLTQYMLHKSQSAAAMSGLNAAQLQALQAQSAASAGRLAVPGAGSALLPQAAGQAGAIPVGAPQSAGTVNAAAPAVPAPIEKKPGVVRIGVVMPKAQLGQGAQGPAAGEPLRAMLVQYLAGPSVEVMSILALLPQQIEAEAQAKQCDYLVYSNFTQKKSGGSSMGFLKAASSMASMVPMMGGAASMAGAIAATSAASAASEAATLSNGIKAKTEVVMEYHVSAPGAPTPVLSTTTSAKAKTDGEDVFTPLIEQEATAIMAEVTKKK
jgi:hypothetical protein